MAEAKTKEHDDITFSRDALVSDDLRVADEEREKRNKPMPEEFRDAPEKLDGWPVPEDKLPAVMRADQKDSNDYKMATHKEVDPELRDRELAAGPGSVAAAEQRKLVQEAVKNQESLNDFQAPPTPAAQAAADGAGAESNPIPVINPATGQQVNAQLANPTAKPAAQRADAKK